MASDSPAFTIVDAASPASEPAQALTSHAPTECAHRVESLAISKIIQLSARIKELQAEGKTVYNLTLGDFSPQYFPMPDRLKELIIQAYKDNLTSYAPASGLLELRESVTKYLERFQHVQYTADEVIVTSGARAGIFLATQALVGPADKIVYAVPSWNTKSYGALTAGVSIVLDASPDNGFMPLPEQLEPHIADASLIALCSPLNPSGTVMSRKTVEAITEMVIAENKRRDTQGRRRLYVLFDMIYWNLTYRGEFVSPVQVDSRMKEFTICIDGISKCFASTGVRVGWAVGPAHVIGRMKALLGHMGAWAPKPEQWATAKFLCEFDVVEAYLADTRGKVHARLQALAAGIQALKSEGLPCDCIPPAAAMYLTVKFPLVGRHTSDGKAIANVEDQSKWLLENASLGIVPFNAFGATTTEWYRISVGTIDLDDIDLIISDLRTALKTLT
eukprot:m.351705 g.351705  ORF g.351705 m.351705 type:complete len:447 (-) comp19898_c1_seq5:1446-2786(-)